MNAAERPTPETVERAAALARLALGDARRAELAQQCARILEAFRSLGELDVESVAPLTSPVERCDVLRDDRARPSLERETLLANAPQREGEFFGVPKTVGGEA